MFGVITRHSMSSALGSMLNWCDVRFELDGPQVRRAIALFCKNIGTALRRNIKLVEPSPAPPIVAPRYAEDAAGPARSTPPPMPDHPAPPKRVPPPDPVAIVDPVEPLSVRSKRRFSFSRVGLAGLCGAALMLQGLITLVGLLGSNALAIEIVLVIVTCGSLVVGFSVQREQSARRLLLALCTSLIGLLLCLALLAGMLGYLVLATRQLTASGIVLFAISAVLAGAQLRKERMNTPSATSKATIRKAGQAD
jgi:hypothetical protein